MRTMTALLGLATALAAATPALAQYGTAVIVTHRHHDDGPVVPYATPGYGSISTAKQASDACARDALGQVGNGAKLAGKPRAATMSTGWEVNGAVDDGHGVIPFVCSVRNGSVSGLTLKRD